VNIKEVDIDTQSHIVYCYILDRVLFWYDEQGAF